MSINHISKLFKFIVHIFINIMDLINMGISKLFKFIVHYNSFISFTCFSYISKLFKFIVHTFISGTSYKKYRNFKTFQVYSSCFFCFFYKFQNFYFKTFQVYSSWKWRKRKQQHQCISKLFKFIVHKINDHNNNGLKLFQNFSSL